MERELYIQGASTGHMGMEETAETQGGPGSSSSQA